MAPPPAVFVLYRLNSLSQHWVVERIQNTPEFCRRTFFTIPSQPNGWTDRTLYTGPCTGLVRIKKKFADGMAIPGDFASDNFAGLALASEPPHRWFED